MCLYTPPCAPVILPPSKIFVLAVLQNFSFSFHIFSRVHYERRYVLFVFWRDVYFFDLMIHSCNNTWDLCNFFYNFIHWLSCIIFIHIFRYIGGYLSSFPESFVTWTVVITITHKLMHTYMWFSIVNSLW